VAPQRPTATAAGPAHPCRRTSAGTPAHRNPRPKLAAPRREGSLRQVPTSIHRVSTRNSQHLVNSCALCSSVPMAACRPEGPLVTRANHQQHICRNQPDMEVRNRPVSAWRARWAASALLWAQQGQSPNANVRCTHKLKRNDTGGKCSKRTNTHMHPDDGARKHAAAGHRRSNAGGQKVWASSEIVNYLVRACWQSACCRLTAPPGGRTASVHLGPPRSGPRTCAG
jgi:hypothetical protein